MNQRIDQLSRDEIKAIQRILVREKYMPPLLPSGDPSDDGLWGPVTARAISIYWNEHQQDGLPVISPAPAMPWWGSKGIWGSMLTVVSSLGGALGIAWLAFDPREATEVVMPLVELLPFAFTAIGGILSWWGRKNAKAPVDPTLVARIRGNDIRLPMLADPKRAPSDPFGHFGG